MGKALYRKHRSKSLAEIVGQDHVTTILSSALKNNRIAHAYLFTGPKGVGKTSIARILAHEINNLPYHEESTHLDIIEIDAASNNGVDDIRDLRDKVNIAPSSAKKKVYIIDEVHMLSKPAFNALLKTLEEPPEHVVFILATTDLDKLPDTIISRTQRYEFKQASTADIIKNLRRIADIEKISIDDAALRLLAEHSGGSYRDSVSLLDQLATVGGKSAIGSNHIEQALGLAPSKKITDLLQRLLHHDFDQLVTAISTLQHDGVQASITATQLIHAVQRDPQTYADLLPLVQQLISVRQSSMPDSLLLSILGTYSYKSTPTSKAVNTSQKLPSIELTPLEKKAVELQPKEDIVPRSEDPLLPLTNLSKPTLSDVDLTSLMKDISSLSIGLRSVLSKCSAEAVDRSNIVVYTRTEFYKKKLDTPKYRQELYQFFRDKTASEWEISFIPSLPPPKNQTVATVTAIMGGGEEVSID